MTFFLVTFQGWSMLPVKGGAPFHHMSSNLTRKKKCLNVFDVISGQVCYSLSSLVYAMLCKAYLVNLSVFLESVTAACL